ncbi:hypothetical protein BJV82DRAFT_597578, partial [Fennellomyces sp. T-0311]
MSTFGQDEAWIRVIDTAARLLMTNLIGDIVPEVSHRDIFLLHFCSPPMTTDTRKRSVDDRRSSFEVMSDSETDNEEAFDLTNDLTSTSSTNQASSSMGMNGADDETLSFFQEAGLSEEMLAQLGIDPEEIRAQRQLEQRSEQDRRDRELALQMQQQLNAAQPSSFTAAPTTVPPPPAPPGNGLIGMSAQPIPPRTLPPSFAISQQYMEAFRRSLAEYQYAQHGAKRQKI